MTDTQPTVFVVDSEEVLCRSLRWLIKAHGWAVEAHACGADFLGTYNPERPGCLLLDVQLRNPSVLGFCERLSARQCTLPVIIAGVNGDVGLAVCLMKAGVFDFLQEPVEVQDLLEQIRAAVELNRRQRAALAWRTALAQRVARLTPRQRQVLELVVAGRTNRETARELGVREKTVEAHRRQVMQKMEATSAADLLRMVLSCRSVVAGDLLFAGGSPKKGRPRPPRAG